VVAGLALEAVRRRMFTRWGRWIEERFGHLLVQQGLDSASFNRASTTQQALDDLATVRGFVTGPAISWIDLLWAPFFFIAGYLVHPVFGLIGGIAVVGLVLLSMLQEWATREPRRASRRAYDHADDIVVTAERQIESVGALTMTPHLTERWRQRMSERHDERDRAQSRQALFAFLRQALGQGVYLGSIAIGIWLFLHNALTLGGVFAGRIMLGSGYRLIDRALGSWRSLRDAASCYQAVKQQLTVEAATPPSVDEANRTAPLILEEVSFRYRDQPDPVIRGLSLTLEPGEVLLVTGTATTGKSTLSRLLVGLIEPRYGHVRLGDIDLVRLPAEMRADLIGYLPQHTELFPGTIRENIARMDEGDFREIVAAAKLVDIHEMIIRFPEGYDTEITAEHLGLSGSQRKRIALARAMYKRPRLLVLDEPTANLDRPSRRILESAIVELKQHGCSVVVTQAVPAARWNTVADKFLILSGRAPRFSVGQPPDAEPAQDSGRGRLRSLT
jgi:ABC-type protease/lipase transport system fused ATPase/permease subunit